MTKLILKNKKTGVILQNKKSLYQQTDCFNAHVHITVINLVVLYKHGPDCRGYEKLGQ